MIENKNEVEIIREPGGTDISEIIRPIILDKKHNKMFMETEIFLFSAARAQLVREKIRPYLDKNYFVISDRFHDSTTAYQGYGRGISLELVKHINSLAIGDTIPDITFFIDIPVEEAEKRKQAKKRLNLDRIETSDSDFYNRVRNGYIALSKNEKRFNRIDGLKSIEDIHNEIIKEILSFEKKETV